MVEMIAKESVMGYPPDISHLITEDDTPVDNIFSAKQQRFLIRSLYASWQPDRTFLADSNVGVFITPYRPAIVPDAFLSLDVEITEDWFAQEHRSYFIWEFGKPPDVVIEIVSNKKGGERDKKLRDYARMGVWYYAIYDPQQLIQDEELELYELKAGQYVVKDNLFLENVNLGLTLWDGLYEDRDGRWLRWQDVNDNLLLTGKEIAVLEKQQAEAERQQAEAERQRAERLAEKLRALGIDPDE
jgi:Uma2 family endonuclease